MTIKELLLKNNNILPVGEVELLLSYALHRPLEYLYKNPQKNLRVSTIAKFRRNLKLRLAHTPMAYLAGYKEFFGLKFKVNKNVLVPRPETEILVEEALKYLANKTNLNVLEMATGSGCIIISSAKNASQNNYLVTDISKPALHIAQTNARQHGLKNKIKFIKSNLFTKIPAGKYNLILANLPYLTSKQMAESSIKQEPRLALLAGKDGLKYYERFFSQVNTFLAEKYQILIEIDPDQTEKIKEIIKNNLPKSKIEIIKDLAGLDRVVKVNN